MNFKIRYDESQTCCIPLSVRYHFTVLLDEVLHESDQIDV